MLRMKLEEIAVFEHFEDSDKYLDIKGYTYNYLIEHYEQLVEEVPESLGLIKQYADSAEEWYTSIRYEDKTPERNAMVQLAVLDNTLQRVERQVGHVFEMFTSNWPSEFEDFKSRARKQKTWQELRSYVVELEAGFVKDCKETLGEHYEMFSVLLNYFKLLQRNDQRRIDADIFAEVQQEDIYAPPALEQEEGCSKPEHSRKRCRQTDTDEDSRNEAEPSSEEYSSRKRRKIAGMRRSRNTLPPTPITPPSTDKNTCEDSGNETEQSVEEERPSKRQKQTASYVTIPSPAPVPSPALVPSPAQTVASIIANLRKLGEKISKEGESASSHSEACRCVHRFKVLRDKQGEDVSEAAQDFCRRLGYSHVTVDDIRRIISWMLKMSLDKCLRPYLADF